MWQQDPEFDWVRRAELTALSIRVLSDMLPMEPWCCIVHAGKYEKVQASKQLAVVAGSAAEGCGASRYLDPRRGIR